MESFLPHGIIPPIVTPFDRDGKLDEGGFRTLLRHLQQGSVHGVFVGGSQGEFYALSVDEKQRLFEIAVDEVGGQLRIYAGTGAITTRETVRLTQIAHDVGVDAVSIITPYFITPNQTEVLHHYRSVVEAVEIPTLLYNHPLRTKITIQPETVASLAEFDHVVGIKDSSGSLEQALRYITSTSRPFSVLAGNDAMVLAVLLLGGAGAIVTSANVAPEISVALYDAFQSGDLDSARQKQLELLAFRDVIGLGTFPAAMKDALRMLDLPAGPPRPPIQPLSDVDRTHLRSALQAVNLIPEEA